MELHFQCKMHGARGHYTAWLPQKFAKVGQYVLISDNFVGGNYRVLDVGTALPSDYVMKRSRDYREQRKASDI
jgi:hypothetical protein